MSGCHVPYTLGSLALKGYHCDCPCHRAVINELVCWCRCNQVHQVKQKDNVTTLELKKNHFFEVIDL
jgi:hypothetical protein